METFDAIVIGTGGVGSAAAMHLAGRGARVLGLDRFPPGHDRGSSHGQTRIIRTAYFEHPDYVPLLRRAYTLWSQLEQHSGDRLFHRAGLLQIGAADGSVVRGVKQAAELHGLPIQEVTPAECRKRFPGFRMEPDQLGQFEANAGYLLVEQCVIAHARLATQRGADLRHGVEVRGWRPENGRVAVETDAGSFRAANLIIAAGAWSEKLISHLGVPLRVVRKPLYWFATQDDTYRQESGSPCFLYELPGHTVYGFPQIDARGVKAAEHSGGEPVANPLNVDRNLDAQDAADVGRLISAWLPGVTSRLVDHATCMYTMSPDAHFIIDRHPEHPQVAFAAGLSGHGFKFTNVLGEVLSELALDGAASQAIGFLSLDRFAEARG
jgi:sarcosine oxidase